MDAPRHESPSIHGGPPRFSRKDVVQFRAAYEVPPQPRNRKERRAEERLMRKARKSR